MSQVTGEIRVHIRWMVRRDMVEVLEIERESFEFPWTEEEFINSLRQRNCIGMVAEYNGEVVGFVIYELAKSKIQLINLAVASRYRRLGVGTQLTAKLISKLSYQHRSRISFEIRETNLGAQLFFRTVGFRATQILRNYYQEMSEDAYLMQYRYVANESEPVAIPLNNRIARRLAG